MAKGTEGAVLLLIEYLKLTRVPISVERAHSELVLYSRVLDQDVTY